MEAYGLLVIVIGVCLILLQIFFEIHLRTDDKYIAKKSSENIQKELEEKKEKGELNLFYSIDLNSRKFIIRRFLFKIGVLLICIGIICIVMIYKVIY